MPFNEFVAQMVAEERWKDARREVEQKRLEQAAGPSRPRVLDPVLAGLGGLLISAGQKLQRRYTSVQGEWKSSPSPASQ